MTNPLKKTMVYLGLADEELEYEEQASSSTSRRRIRLPSHPFPILPRSPLRPDVHR